MSQEPLADQISGNYGFAPVEEKTATEIARINVEKRTYQKEYMDYWNSTSSRTKTGKPVDAFIMPVAPFAAAIPGQYEYHGTPPSRPTVMILTCVVLGYSMVANVLDYSATVFPVTLADQEIDLFQKDYTPLNDLDNRMWRNCKSAPGTHTTVLQGLT